MIGSRPAFDDYATSIRYLEDLITRPILSREQAGLGRITALLAAVGNPQRRFSTVQVAGTTGKGSTTTIAATILREAGYRTGSFTSPHLQSYRERIAIDGVPIDRELWFSTFSRLLPVLNLMENNELAGYTAGRAAFLEVLWAMACLAFAERGVEHVVVETGLGGRLDPTTANNATVAVITNVSLDHVERLGRTVEAIAAEKAGLIKPGQHVISACEGEALAVVRETCARQEATLWPVGHDGPNAVIRLLAGDGGREGAFVVRTPYREHQCLRLGMLGAHQRLNAACAIGAVDALATRTGLAVPGSAVAAGVSLARIPGRLELFDGRPRVLLDGAHNAAGAASLAAALRTLFAGDRVVLLLGILGDKDVTTITRILSPLAGAIVVSEPPWRSRAGFAGSVAAEARHFCATVEQCDDPGEALARARTLAGSGDLVVVAGSLYLVGAVRDLLVPEAADPPVA